MAATTLNSIGLLFDIIGAIMIFIYGIQPGLQKPIHKAIFDDFDESPDKNEKYNLYKIKSYVGLAVLILGFLFQLLSNFCK